HARGRVQLARHRHADRRGARFPRLPAAAGDLLAHRRRGRGGEPDRRPRLRTPRPPGPRVTGPAAAQPTTAAVRRRAAVRRSAGFATRFLGRTDGLVGVIILGYFAFIAAFPGIFVGPLEDVTTATGLPVHAPYAAHVFGTDQLGDDRPDHPVPSALAEGADVRRPGARHRFGSGADHAPAHPAQRREPDRGPGGSDLRGRGVHRDDAVVHWSRRPGRAVVGPGPEHGPGRRGARPRRLVVYRPAGGLRGPRRPVVHARGQRARRHSQSEVGEPPQSGRRAVTEQPIPAM